MSKKKREMVAKCAESLNLVVQIWSPGDRHGTRYAFSEDRNGAYYRVSPTVFGWQRALEWLDAYETGWDACKKKYNIEEPEQTSQ